MVQTGVTNTGCLRASICVTHSFYRDDLRGSTRHIMRERGRCMDCGIPIIRTYDFRTREEDWIFPAAEAEGRE